MRIHFEILIPIVLILIAMIGIFAVISVRRGGFSLREITIIAILTAIAASGRVAFQWGMHAQPASFIIVLSGLLLGGGVGYTVGILTAFVSNLILGTAFAPYAPWQMLLWGMIGLSSALIRKRGRITAAAFGVAWGFIFGWVMNISMISIMGVGENLTFIAAFLAACVSSFPMDLAHGLATGGLLLLFSQKEMEYFSQKVLKKFPK